MLAKVGNFVFQYSMIVIGAILGAISYLLFIQPFDLATSGVTGISIILNELFGTPIGLVTLLLNIPIFIMGYFMLPGGWRMLVKTLFAVLVYTFSLDLLGQIIPIEPLSDNILLNVLFAGVVGGISLGLLIRMGATLAGTSMIARIINHKFGTPMSATYLYTDVVIIALTGFVFGWEAALFAIVTLFVGGLATDYVMEGPSVIRTVTIITDKPEAVSEIILHTLHRGVTAIPSKGMYTGKEHTMLYITISRSQVSMLSEMVSNIDPNAFIVVGQGHKAYGYGFHRIPKPIIH